MFNAKVRCLRDDACIFYTGGIYKIKDGILYNKHKDAFAMDGRTLLMMDIEPATEIMDRIASIEHLNMDLSLEFELVEEESSDKIINKLKYIFTYNNENIEIKDGFFIHMNDGESYVCVNGMAIGKKNTTHISNIILNRQQDVKWILKNCQSFNDCDSQVGEVVYATTVYIRESEAAELLKKYTGKNYKIVGDITVIREYGV